MADNHSRNHNVPITPRRARSLLTDGRPRDGISRRTRTRIAHSSTMSTPRSKDVASGSDYHSGAPAEAKDTIRNRVVFDRWNELHRAFDFPRNGFPAGTIEEFVRIFVPSDATTLECDDDLQKGLADYAKDIPTNKLETKTYTSIVKLFMKCQEGFDNSRKILFGNTCGMRLRGPSSSDHKTGPDILGSYPGMPLPTVVSERTWDKYAVPAEVKMDEDPIDMNTGVANPTEDNVNTIAQIVKNARNLLFFSSSCYVFVIGIYCSTRQMRIYRFDHSGSVSCGFNYVEKPHIIREFLWRLVNPRHNIPHTVVGWDESIRIPSKGDMEEMQTVVGQQFGYKRQLDVRQCRWVRVRLDCAAFRVQMGISDVPSTESGRKADYYDLEGFTFGTPLHKASGLFSRASYVSRVAVQVPDEGGNRYYQFVLKDSWHQALRESEASYYQTIQERFQQLKEEDSRKFAWIQEVIPDFDMSSNRIPGLAEYYGYLDLSTYDLPSDSDEQHSKKSSSQSSDGSAPSLLSPSDDRGHSTVTSRLLNREIASEKTRGRSLTGPLGRSLTEFDTTRDVVIAIRDAIVGHFIATSCGVLHRDISIGNILMTRKGDRLEGFLHDFDFASFVMEEAENLTDSEQILKDLKRMTGTRQFMAIDILRELPHKLHHDLESFYWVLIWIVLRYTDNTSDQSCTELFDQVGNSTARIVKQGWIAQVDEPVTIRDNTSLTTLLADLREILQKYHSKAREIPTHEVIVRALQAKLDATGWPVSDFPIEFRHPTRKDIAATYSNSMQASSEQATHRSSMAASRSTPASNISHGKHTAPEQSVASQVIQDSPPNGYSFSGSTPPQSNVLPLLSPSDRLPLRRPHPPDERLWLYRPRLEVPASSRTSQSLKRQINAEDENPKKKRRATGSGSDGL